MKKLLVLVIVFGVAAVAGWLYLRQPASITNSGYSYRLSVDRATKTSTGNDNALKVQKDSVKASFTASPYKSASDDCPTVAPTKQRVITVLNTSAPLCISQGGGIVVMPFQYDSVWHLASLSFETTPDYDQAAAILSTLQVKKD